MPIARIVVAPIPTTDWWSIHIVGTDPDIVCGCSRSTAPRERAIREAQEEARFYHCPVVTYPEED